MPDDAHFELSGCVNKQNMRCLSEANPYEFNLKALYSQKVTVWCGISTFGIIGPFIFEDETGQRGYYDIWPICDYGE
jgi:hypothetical protein